MANLSILRALICFLFFTLNLPLIFSQAAGTTSTESAASSTSASIEIQSEAVFTFDIYSLLVLAIIVLMLPLFFIIKTYIGAMNIFLIKQMSEKNRKLTSLVLLLFSYIVVSGQTVKNTVSENMQFWSLITILVFQLALIIYFSIETLNIQKKTIGFDLPIVEKSKTIFNKNWFRTAWDKANNFKPIGEELDLDTGHSYDGIRELDNRAPAWFTFSFLLSIIFAIGYMYVYHVGKTAPLQIEEYQIEVANAKKEAALYLSTQANSIDENSVVMGGADDIANGKSIFGEKCGACHQAHGGSMAGGVGPNLTDDYWLHGGSIKSIFASIKYGWPEKGMIAWQDQLSPVQMSQLSSYINSIKGTNPPGAKEPQGDLYEEVAIATIDTTSQTK